MPAMKKILIVTVLLLTLTAFQKNDDPAESDTHRTTEQSSGRIAETHHEKENSLVRGDSGAVSSFQTPIPLRRIVIGDSVGFQYHDGYGLINKYLTRLEHDVHITSGKLGIGTTSFDDGPDIYKLSVNGRVRAHAVKVYTDWADYVFEPDYQLPSLYDVEAYIEANGHLKDIPSATEVESNGIELGEMNKLLLQKIEELTLYTIALKRQLDTLADKVETHEN